jgi:hypothetical protein
VNDEIDIERRIRRYWFEDGFAELGLGALFTVVGLAFAIGALADDPTLRALALAMLLVVVVLGTIAVRALIRVSKERFTYPRTGYVEYRRAASRGRSVAAILVIAVGASLAVAAQAGAPDRTLAVQTLTLAAVICIPGLRFGLFRFYGLAAATLAAGGAGLLLVLGESGGSALLYGGSGVVLLLSGASTLWAYLRHAGAAGGEN